MALPVNRPYSEISISTHMADLSTASSAYIVAPFRGRLKRAWTVITNAVTTANATVLVKVHRINSSGITQTGTTVGTITVATSGSAAGDVDSIEIGYKGTDNFVNEGDLISFVTDGGCDTTCVTRCHAIIDRVN
jgi:hypothetical protein